MLGEYFGRAIYYQVVRKDCCGWQPLEPSMATLAGPQTIHIAYHVPVAPLILDTASVTSPNGAADGFTATDALGDIPIARVAVNRDGRSIDISLTRPVSGSATVDYARDGIGRLPGPTTGARGCLHDSDPMISRYDGSPRPNWSVGFTALEVE